MKTPNLRIIGLEEEENQVKGTKNIFQQNHKWRFLKFKEGDAHQGAKGTQNTK